MARGRGPAAPGRRFGRIWADFGAPKSAGSARNRRVPRRFRTGTGRVADLAGQGRFLAPKNLALTAPDRAPAASPARIRRLVRNFAARLGFFLPRLRKNRATARAARIFSPPTPKKSGRCAKKFREFSEKIRDYCKISGRDPGRSEILRGCRQFFLPTRKFLLGEQKKFGGSRNFFVRHKKIRDPRTFSWHPRQKNSRRQKNFRRVQKNSAALPIFFVTSGKKFRRPTIFARCKNFFCRTQNFFRR